MKTLPVPKCDFIGLNDKIHLATGGEPPLLIHHRNAFELFAADKARGMDGYSNHWRVIDEVREQLSSLLKLKADEIALIGNASEGIIKVLSSIDWQPGDNVVSSKHDYASGRYALANLKLRGVELRLVSSRNWRIETDDLLKACDSNTKVLYISQVNALTGQLLDIKSLSENLNNTPTILILDASHALGIVPVQAALADFTVSSCYKFALGIHEGIFAWNSNRCPIFSPFGTGWAAATPGETPDSFILKPGARRAEFGNSGHLGAYLLRESLNYLNECGYTAVSNHVQTICRHMIQTMAELNLDVMTPATLGEQAGNAAFAHSDPSAVVSKAEEDGIILWGDNMRVRASVHVFTSIDDAQTFLDRLPNYINHS